MANDSNKIVEEIEIRADNKQAKKASDEVEREFKTNYAKMEKTAKKFSNESKKSIKDYTDTSKKKSQELTNQFDKMFTKAAFKAAVFNQALSLGVRGIGFLIGQMKAGVDSAIEYEKTTLQLTATIEGLGLSSERWVGILQRQAAELQNVAGINDETIRQYQTMALNAGTSADKVDDLMRAAIRLSNAFGMDLQSAIRNLIKTQAGMTGELGEAIPWIRDLTKEQLKAGDAIDLVNEKLDTQLTTLTEGTAGARQGLILAWGDFTEALGKAAVGGEGFNDVMRATSLVLSDLAQSIERHGGGFGIIRAIDLAFLGGEGLRDFEEAEKQLRRNAEAIEAKRRELEETGFITGGAPGGGPAFEFGGKGGIAFDVDKEKKRGGGRVKVPRLAMPDTSDVGAVGFGDEWTERTTARQEHAQMMQESIIEIETNSAQRILEIDRQMNEELDAARKKDFQLSVDQAKKKSEEVGRWAGKGASVALDAIKILATEGPLAMAEYLASQIATIGQGLFVHGVADLARGIAISADPFTPGAGAALIAAGSKEMAIGGAMMAGGTVAGVAIGAAGGGGGGGAGGAPPTGAVAGGFQAGGGGVPTYEPEDRGPQTINIILEGPVYDGAAAGKAIAERLAEAKRQGLIT